MATILAIDDKEDNLISLSAVLNSLVPECTVLTARSGAEGIEKAKIESPDTILLDIKMPDMDGYEVCKRLKEDKDTRHIPVIMISAILTGSKDLIKGLDIGADAYLAKPIDENVLAAQIKTALRIKRAEDQLRDQKDLLEEMVREKTRALRESEERMKAILRASPVGIGLVIDRKLDWANQTMYRMIGYEEGSLFGQKAQVLYPDNAEHKRAGQELSSGIEETGTGDVTTRWVRKDGTAFDCAIRACSLDPKHPSRGQIVIVSDISESKRLESQLQQAQKMEAIGTLAGGIAHDFNNILTTIIGNAHMALMEVGKDGPLREELEEIKIAGGRASDLTRQLLAFSRKQIIQPKILDLNELLSGMGKMLGRLIREDVEFLTIPGPELWHVETDPGQIEQVIMNLVINARDAMPTGGKLTVETANVDLDKNYLREHGIQEEQPGTYVMLVVSDTGSGMDKETQEHIFEPFFTTKGIGKGTGLGLSTAYGIAKQNNGFIWVYSEPGQGSTFKVYLPRVKRDVQAEEKERTCVEELGGSETVLIVEDDYSLRNFTEKALQQHGYRTLAAENGEDALRISKEHEGPIDLMLTDVVMPRMSGKETAERLQPLYPQMKVIYMSGYTDNAIVHHGVLKPGLNFLEKPFSPKALARRVREVLDK